MANDMETGGGYIGFGVDLLLVNTQWEGKDADSKGRADGK